MFPKHLGACHELFYVSSCQYLLTTVCLGSSILPQSLAFPHSVQFLPYTGNLHCLCKVPQYMHLLWDTFLFLFVLFGHYLVDHLSVQCQILCFFGCFMYDLLALCASTHLAQNTSSLVISSGFLKSAIHSFIISVIISSLFMPFITVLSASYSFLCNHIHLPLFLGSAFILLHFYFALLLTCNIAMIILFPYVEA